MTSVAFQKALPIDWDVLTEDMRNRAEGARDDTDMLLAWAAMAHGLGDGPPRTGESSGSQIQVASVSDPRSFD